MKVYLLYTGNAWMNTSSLQLIAVCTSTERARELALTHASEGDEPLDEEAIDELIRNRQTYGRNENYMISETETDELE